MKRNLLLVSMIAALVLSGCNNNKEPEDKTSDPVTTSNVENSSEEPSSMAPSSEPSSNPESSKSSDKPSSSQAPSSQAPSSKPASSRPPKSEGESNANFTLMEIDDVSSMSANCKKYVDDMRAQQQRLIQEKGANADYYINDLYGTSGVDITKGITAGSNKNNQGGYWDGKTENEYLDPIGAVWENGEKSDENKGIEIEFKPADSLKNQEYTILYGMKEDLSDAKEIKTNDTKVAIKNLLVNQKYYYKVTAGENESPLANFTTGDYPRWIDARPMFNVRDHGGYMTSSGQRIKQGMVFRGGEITAAVGWKSGNQYTGDPGGRYTDANGRMQDGHITTQTDASKKIFREDMNMVGGLEIDLRSSGERNNYNACGFANGGDIGYKLLSISSYDSGMKNNTSLIKQVFDAFAQADTKPVYYHCYGGADRTGTIGFLLGALLGMSYTDLVIDFELTSYSSNPSRNYRSHLREGPYNYWPELLDYLKNTLGWNSSKTIKQGAEEYLKNKCSVSQSTIDTIRNIMLEPAT